MAVKALGIYGIARAFGADSREALQRAALFAQGGEFAFVLYAAALAAGIFDTRAGAVMSAMKAPAMPKVAAVTPDTRRAARSSQIDPASAMTR